MKVLVLNCGSSSLKCQLIDMDTGERIMKGHYERIGGSISLLRFNVRGNKTEIEKPARNHKEAISRILNLLMSEEYKVINSYEDIGAVGHRVLNAGEKYKESVLITEEVEKAIEDSIILAPIHNPACLMGIKACKSILPNTPMVAVFDTSFHFTMPEKVFMYQLPYKFYEEYGIRKYGAHGISHKYVSERIAEIAGSKEINVVNCHLGQGCSLCAIKNGQSVDTTMGLTPLAGIPMGTRSGDIDPSIIPIVMKLYDLSPDNMLKILNKESGAYGMSGVSTDFRDIERAAADGDERSILTLDSRAYLIAQYIAKMMIPLEHIDYITFSGGVGENGCEERERICNYLRCFGVKIDTEANKTKRKEALISAPDSSIKLYVVPTNEELLIARDTNEIVSKL